jgi:folate-dependent phosphoribosylglycinamide formyltransferase PurN
VRPGDTPETLGERVFEQERVAYPEAIRLFAGQQLAINGETVEVLAL